MDPGRKERPERASNPWIPGSVARRVPPVAPESWDSP